MDKIYFVCYQVISDYLIKPIWISVWNPVRHLGLCNFASTWNCTAQNAWMCCETQPIGEISQHKMPQALAYHPKQYWFRFFESECRSKLESIFNWLEQLNLMIEPNEWWLEGVNGGCSMVIRLLCVPDKTFIFEKLHGARRSRSAEGERSPYRRQCLRWISAGKLCNLESISSILAKFAGWTSLPTSPSQTRTDIHGYIRNFDENSGHL